MTAIMWEDGEPAIKKVENMNCEIHEGHKEGKVSVGLHKLRY